MPQFANATGSIDGHALGDAGLRLRMRSEERRITGQHEKLDTLCRDLYCTLEKEGAVQAMSGFCVFRAALDAHLTVEEDIYFPALHGLRPDIGRELERLVDEHDELRFGLEGVKQALQAGDAGIAGLELKALALRIDEHEQREEDLIARVNEAPVMNDGRGFF